MKFSYQVGMSDASIAYIARIAGVSNGIISHNLPVATQIVGSMATRTTHPLSLTRLNRLNAAAVAGHYGSISIVTFLAGTSLLGMRGVEAEGYDLPALYQFELFAVAVDMTAAATRQTRRTPARRRPATSPAATTAATRRASATSCSRSFARARRPPPTSPETSSMPCCRTASWS